MLEMDKNWQPKKKIIIEKLASVKNKKRTEKILSAKEYEGDKTRNLTAQYQAEAAKFRESHGSGEEEVGSARGRHRGLNLSRDEIFPFSEEKRKDYDFELNDGTLIDEQKVSMSLRPV